MRHSLRVAVLASGLAACEGASAAPDASTALADAALADAAAADALAPPDATPPDLTPPSTSLTATPPSLTRSGSASFEFTADEPDCSFMCALDGIGFTPCVSPLAATVSEGEHTFQVFAVDPAGNADATPAMHAWVVDLTPPDTRIISAPPALDNSRSASFELGSSDAGARFECRLDDTAFAACTSPASFMALADGGHTFQARAIDAAGNLDATPATHTWIVDTGTPDTSITAGPTGRVATTSATFAFAASEASATFACSLDAAAFAVCTSPRALNALAQGPHSFRVRAIDVAGHVDATPAQRAWTVDTVGPAVTVTGGPNGLTSDSTPSFSFTSEAGASFACATDAGTFAACGSPFTSDVLGDGTHTFWVHARDAIGNTGATTTRGFTIDATAPDTFITSAPEDPLMGTSAHFTFSASERPATFECSLESAAFGACRTPLELAGLSYGTHSLRVRARDQAGNLDASPAAYAWTSQPVADADADRLPDSVETNTGVYIGPGNTGTSPTNPDTDGDGIPDGDEVLGTTGGLDLPAMGLDPLRKNVLLEYDWFDDSFDCGPHSHRPTPALLDRVGAVFAGGQVDNPDGSTGVTLVHDYGQGGAFTGGNFIDDPDGWIMGIFGNEYQAYKAANFAANRQGYFHYVLLPHFTENGYSWAEILGDDIMVSLGCSNTEYNVGNVLMHELGHNLGLHHGGRGDPTNYKPNYNSVMNYRFVYAGIDNNCTPDGDGVLDYSRHERIDLDENALDETKGTCGNVAWDWNSNAVVDTSPVALDLNADSLLMVLTDSNDWANLLFDFTPAGPAPRAAPEVVVCDLGRP